jgi:hypothetical protein
MIKSHEFRFARLYLYLASLLWWLFRFVSVFGRHFWGARRIGVGKIGKKRGFWKFFPVF